MITIYNLTRAGFELLQGSIPEAIKTAECDEDTFYYVELENTKMTYNIHFVIFETDVCYVTLVRNDFYKLEVM